MRKNSAARQEWDSEEQPEAESLVKIEYPPETSRMLSWGAMEFIHAPASRVAQFTVISLSAAFAIMLLLAHLVPMDRSIVADGEVGVDIGTREALVLSSGLIRDGGKVDGSHVEAGSVLATVGMEATSDTDILDTSEKIHQLVEQLEARLKTRKTESEKGTELEVSFPKAHSIYSSSLLAQVALIEQAVRSYLEERNTTFQKLHEQLVPGQQRIALLTGRLEKMKKSHRKDLLSTYMESVEEELGRLKTQVLSEQDQANSRFQNTLSELIKTVRVAAGVFDDYIEQHRVRAPVSGVLAKRYLENNANAQPGKLYATIMPEEGKLIAEIRVASKDVVQVKVGQKVLLRMEAFPYQKYGSFEGKVERVDLIASGATGEEGTFLVKANMGTADRLSPELRERVKFIVGMKFNALIITERKPLAWLVYDRVFGGH
jgi:membrane fusion protein